MRLLDTFCKAGGASMGYARAGFEVVGVDIEPQPNYPFEFIQADAVEFIREHGASFDVMAGSPPCQAHSDLKARTRHINHPDLVGPTREAMRSTGRPYVIENVEGAPLLAPVTLCGSAFGLDVRRHRIFESNLSLDGTQCSHASQTRRFRIFEHGAWRESNVVPVYGVGGGKAKEHWAEAMGIDWMTHEEMAQAIPPAFTEFLGGQLLMHLLTGAA